MPDIGARKTELETAIPPIFKGLRHDDGEPVTGVSFFSACRIIATAAAHCELKPWAVKLHAYTLDSSIKCASAVQQKQVFPQLLGIALFLGRWRDKGCAPAKPVRPENNLELPFIH